MDKPASGSGKSLSLTFGVLTLAAIAAPVIDRVFQDHDVTAAQALAVTDITSDQCLRNGVNKVMSQFAAASDAERNEAWSNVSRECVQNYGLPQNVEINLNGTGRAPQTYLQELNPTGN